MPANKDKISEPKMIEQLLSQKHFGHCATTWGAIQLYTYTAHPRRLPAFLVGVFGVGGCKTTPPLAAGVVGTLALYYALGPRKDTVKDTHHP